HKYCKLSHCNTKHFVLVLQCGLKRGKFHFPLLSPLDCVDLLYANATYPFYKNKMGKRSFFLSYKKKKKKRRFSSSEIVPLSSKTMDETTKYLSYFVCSSTKTLQQNPLIHNSCSNIPECYYVFHHAL